MASIEQDLPATRPTLFLQLRAAIRTDHAVLNKAIFARFPECVPPKAENPYFYVAGMSVFGQIYCAIEESWRRILEQTDDDNDDRARHKEILQRLKTQYLERKDKLMHDVEYIEKRILPTEASLFLAEITTKGSIFKDRAADAIMTNPPILLAYAWIMYLALFNGGRWMAGELVAAGPPFWLKEGNDETYSQEFLSFWFFDDHSPKDTKNHGDTVKADFCRRFNHAAELVNEIEQEQIVEESRKLLHMCIEMVEYLDGQELQAHLQMMQSKKAAATHHVSIIDRCLTTLSAPVTAMWSSIAGRAS